MNNSPWFYKESEYIVLNHLQLMMLQISEESQQFVTLLNFEIRRVMDTGMIMVRTAVQHDSENQYGKLIL